MVLRAEDLEDGGKVLSSSSIFCKCLGVAEVCRNIYPIGDCSCWGWGVKLSLILSVSKASSSIPFRSTSYYCLCQCVVWLLNNRSSNSIRGMYGVPQVFVLLFDVPIYIHVTVTQTKHSSLAILSTYFYRPIWGLES